MKFHVIVIIELSSLKVSSKSKLSTASADGSSISDLEVSINFDSEVTFKSFLRQATNIMINVKSTFNIGRTKAIGLYQTKNNPLSTLQFVITFGVSIHF